MERFASTLATTAACVGLMVAGHLIIVHERASVADEPVKARIVAPPSTSATAQSQTRAWAEPPAKPDLHAVATPGPTAWTVAAAESAPAVAAPPAVQAPVQNAEAKAEVKPDKAKRAAEQSRRKKIAQAKARRTQTASRDLPAAVEEPAPQAVPAPARRVDPITDLLRGLGIGREG